jgi:hypothetical protein
LGQLASGPLQEFRLIGEQNGARLHFVQRLVEVRPPEDDFGEPMLDLAPQQRERDQQQANADQKERAIERISGNSRVDGDPLKCDARDGEGQQAGQEHIGEESDECVQQYESIVLQ